MSRNTQKYLLALFQVSSGEKAGVYEVPISERKCISLFRSATKGAIFASDGKSFLYAVASPREVAIYRQPWRDGKVTGESQVALKLPFKFAPYYGSTSDFSPDLSTVVYMRPVYDHADIYFLSQK